MPIESLRCDQSREDGFGWTRGGFLSVLMVLKEYYGDRTFLPVDLAHKGWPVCPVSENQALDQHDGARANPKFPLVQRLNQHYPRQ